jgi:hypothetical protein
MIYTAYLFREYSEFTYSSDLENKCIQNFDWKSSRENISEPKHRWVDTIKMDHRECECVNWIELYQDRIQ